MKLYVLPLESFCNANCSFCITKFRDISDSQYLKLNDLENVLNNFEFSSIEITGGGEPLLHPEIKDISLRCIENATTQLYTNGEFVKKIKGAQGLSYLCLSRAHHDDRKNFRIMKIHYNIDSVFDTGFSVKTSLLLHKSGINNAESLKEYFDWANFKGAKKVVVRQLFDHDYKGKLEGEFISSLDMASKFESEIGEKSAYLSWKGMDVEFELRSCACEMDNPVLHADGELYRGWSREILK
ncbi:MAG: radical SAM protein [Nanoarchaeota archaeon]